MRGRRLLLGTALAAFLLSTGCAAVQTELTVEDDGSGVREMGVVVPQQGMDGADVKAADIEASVKRHLPEELSYEGMETQSEDGEDAVVLRFRLEYDDLEDYEQKVEALLEDSGVDREVEIVQTRTDSDLVEGVQVRENFSSTDLLGWIEAGLEDDDVVEENGVSVNSSQDPDTVVIGGEDYEAGTGALRVEDVKDHGFGGVELVLTRAGEGRYAADLELTHRQEPDRVTRERVERYFEDRLPEGASLEPTSSEGFGFGGYRVSLGEGSADEIADRLKQVTGEDGVRLEQTTRPVDGDPLAVQDVLSYRLDAAQLLSPRAGDHAVSVRIEDGEYAPSASGTQGELTTSRRVDLTRSEHLVTVHSADDVEVRATYGVPVADADEAVRDRLTEALHPDEGGLEVVEEKDGEVQFTSLLRGTPEDVSRHASAFAGMPARITVTEVEGGLRPRSEVNVDVSALAYVLPGEHSARPSLVVELPTGAKVEEGDVHYGNLDGDRVTSDQGLQVSFAMQSVSTGWWIMVGAIALVVLALIAGAVIFRRRIKAGLTGAWGRRDQVVERARATAGSVATAGAAAGAAAGASWAAARAGADGPEDEPRDGEFHESQLR